MKRLCDQRRPSWPQLRFISSIEMRLLSAKSLPTDCRAIQRIEPMADRKRRRLASDAHKNLHKVLRKGGISLNGLADVLQTLRGTSTEDSTMHDLRLANSADFMTVRRVISLPLVGGGTWDWELADPCKLLQLALTRSPWLQEIFSQARKPTSSQPWRIVIGFDEFMPGCIVWLPLNCNQRSFKRESNRLSSFSYNRNLSAVLSSTR